MKSLKQHIEDYKFDYVNDLITEANFPKPEKLRTDFKIFHFNRSISTEEVISEMKKQSYVPANIYEMLEYSNWNGTDWVVALGSVCLDGGRDQCAPGLDRWDRKRMFRLFLLAGVWYDFYRFPAVRELDSKTLGTSVPLDTLPFDPSKLSFEYNGKNYKIVLDSKD
jgi:hypothetical protein